MASGRSSPERWDENRKAGRASPSDHFHVFDPKVVEDLLDRGAVDEWRVEDAEAKAEKRKNAAYQAKLTRLAKKNIKWSKKTEKGFSDDPATRLKGWEDFDVDGLLR